MLELFRAAAADALSLLGEGATLRGTVPCQVNIEHGVQLTGFEDDMVVAKSIATIAKTYAPKVGDTLTHPDGAFVLDAVLVDTQATTRFILRKA